MKREGFDRAPLPAYFNAETIDDDNWSLECKYCALKFRLHKDEVTMDNLHAFINHIRQHGLLP
jgi:hypothetical protein